MLMLATLGLYRFHEDLTTTPRRMRILWLENLLDCRTWSYYCDIRDAMARLHDMCTPHGPHMCDSQWAQRHRAYEMTTFLPTLCPPDSPMSRHLRVS